MKVVTTLWHHPHHLRFLVLTQADRTRRVINIPTTFAVREFRVRVDDTLVKPNDQVLIITLFVIVVLSYEDYARENNTLAWIVVRIVGVVLVLVLVLRAAKARDATAKVRGEEQGGEEDEKAKSDGDGVAEAEVCEVVRCSWSGERGC